MLSKIISVSPLLNSYSYRYFSRAIIIDNCKRKMIDKNFSNSNKSSLVHYDALADKHASFYFNAHGVKKHLKKLKKVIYF